MRCAGGPWSYGFGVGFSFLGLFLFGTRCGGMDVWWSASYGGCNRRFLGGARYFDVSLVKSERSMFSISLWILISKISSVTYVMVEIS